MYVVCSKIYLKYYISHIYMCAEVCLNVIQIIVLKQSCLLRKQNSGTFYEKICMYQCIT